MQDPRVTFVMNMDIVFHSKHTSLLTKETEMKKRNRKPQHQFKSHVCVFCHSKLKINDLFCNDVCMDNFYHTDSVLNYVRCGVRHLEEKK